MGEINSPLGTQQFESVSNKKFVVENVNAARAAPSQQYDLNTPEGRIAAAKARHIRMQNEPQPNFQGAEEAMAERQRLIKEETVPNQAIKTRIEMLVGIGRATREVPIETEDGKVIFSIRTLKGREMRFLADSLQKLTDTKQASDIYDMRSLTLAHSVFAVDGMDIDVVLGVRGQSNAEQVRKQFLDEFDEAILAHLHGKYQEMTQENRNKFAVKTTEDAKEVAESMKKSGEGA